MNTVTQTEDVVATVPIPVKTGRVYLLIQEGGSSMELYVHAWDTYEEAKQDRIDCARDGAYATSEVIDVPASLADHPDFYEVVEDLLRMSHELECVEYDEDEDEEPK